MKQQQSPFQETLAFGCFFVKKLFKMLTYVTICCAFLSFFDKKSSQNRTFATLRTSGLKDYKINRILLGILILSCVTSCTLYTKPKIDPIPIPKEYKNKIKANNRDLKTAWWQNFHDPKLNSLVDKALKNNLNYQIAIKNIEIARTFVDENFSNYFPQVNLNYSSERELLSKNSFTTAQSALTNNRGSSASRRFSLHQLNASVAYQMDFWNQIGNSVNQANADTNAQAANSDIVKLTLISDVTDTYFQLQTFNEILQNLKDQYQVLNEITKLTDKQYKSGLINIEPINDAKIQEDIVKNNILNFSKNQEILKNTLAYLLGEFPEKFNYDVKNNLKSRDFTQLIPAGIPSQTVVLRPDIEQAFYQILSFGFFNGNVWFCEQQF
jgi:multidrug efflux system outer membrane protein